MNHLASGGPVRCLAVWSAVGLAAVALVAWVAPDLRAAGAALRADGLAAQRFEEVVVWLAAAALAGCAAWAWAVTGIVVGLALAGRPRAAVRGVPRWLRAGVLLACGVAVVGAGGAAGADDETARARADHTPLVLDGLPVPDRAVGGPGVPSGPLRVHVVVLGDTLCVIAAADLGGHPAAGRVVAHWQRIHAANRPVIGADPDLIRPGQVLRIPTPLPDRREEPS